MSPVAPRVSVVVSCGGQSRYAYEATASAKSAYAGPLEVLLVEDHGSNPRTRGQLEDAAQRARDERCHIEIVTPDLAGVAAARQNGLSIVTGEFVQLMEGADLLLPGKLDDQMLHFQVAHRLDVSLTDWVFANETLDSFSRNRGLVADFTCDLETLGLHLPLACALFRRSALRSHKFGEYPSSDEQRLFWAQLATSGARIGFIGGPGAMRRVSPENVRGSSEGSRLHEPLPKEQPIARSAPRVRTGPVSPRLSVVIPVYEHYEYLERCLVSVGAQRDDDIEVVIVDDGSRDPRVEPLLIHFASDLRAKLVVRRENRGVSATLDEAVANARGEYVAFLDCDDTLPPDALHEALAYLHENPACDYLFTDRYDISENDQVLRLARYCGYRDDRFTGEFRRDLLNGMVASHLKVIRRASIARVGGFEKESSGVQDWVMALAIAEFGAFGYLAEPLYNQRVHANTVTRSDLRGQVFRANKVRRRFAERYLRQRGVGRFSASAGSIPAPRILTPAEISVRHLSEEWSVQPLIIDASADVTAAEIGKLREFNGYFDKILWSAPEIHASLLGYVWSPDILQRA